MDRRSALGLVGLGVCVVAVLADIEVGLLHMGWLMPAAEAAIVLPIVGIALWMARRDKARA